MRRTFLLQFVLQLDFSFVMLMNYNLLWKSFFGRTFVPVAKHHLSPFAA